MQSKNLVSVMVFAAVAGDDKVIPPHFIETGLKTNTEECLKILIDFLLAWIRENNDHNKVVLVQNSASARGAKKDRVLPEGKSSQVFPNEIRPSSTPDLDVFDFWRFNVIEE